MTNTNNKQTSNRATREQPIRTEAAAAYIGSQPATLKTWRCRGEGPPYLKVSGRMVVYLTSDLDAWLESKRVVHC